MTTAVNTQVPQAPVSRRVKPPAQARSQRSLDRMLKAGATLIAKHGVDGLTIADVVRLAKSSTGAFYARFADKDALVREIQHRFVSQVETRVVGALALDTATLDTEAAAKRVTQILAGVFRENPSLIAGFIRGAGRDEVLRQRADVTFRRLDRGVSEFLGHHLNTPPNAAATLCRIIIATLEHYVGLAETARWTDWKSLTKELEYVAYRYLAE